MSSKILYSVEGPKDLFEMTWEEVSEALKETDIVILPIGSTEQHGPHLPLGSDTIQGTDLAKKAADRLSKEGIKVVVATTIPFGVSSSHMAFPGTLAISSTTLATLIKEICHSLYTHGFRKFVLLNAHGGNDSTIRYVIPELASELPEAHIIEPPILGWNVRAHYPEILSSDKPMEESHSGEGETSRMLASRPELVEMKRAKVYYSKRKDLYPFPVAVRHAVTTARGSFSMKDSTPYGSLGNPLLAKKETGEKQYEIALDKLCETIRDIRALKFVK